MRNLLLTISYDGSNYHGWQVQKNAVTVQEVFQNAVKKLFGHNIDIKGCSRTDSGVHANKYCVSLKRMPIFRVKILLWHSTVICLMILQF